MEGLNNTLDMMLGAEATAMNPSVDCEEERQGQKTKEGKAGGGAMGGTSWPTTTNEMEQQPTPTVCPFFTTVGQTPIVHFTLF